VAAIAHGCPPEYAKLSRPSEPGVLRPLEFLDSVCKDVGTYLLALEYSDIVEPQHYGEQMEWYRLGHFPCGWQGQGPGGRRVVF
jgi:hypothetical protein